MRGIVAQILVIFVLAISMAGCSGTGNPLSNDDPSDASTTTNTSEIIPGEYSGVLSCDYAALNTNTGQSYSDVITENEIAVIDSEGRLVSNGQPVVIGTTSYKSTGAGNWSATITNIQGNGKTIEMWSQAEMNLTDGSLTASVSGTLHEIYLQKNEGRIEHTTTQRLQGTDSIGQSYNYSWDCEARLEKIESDDDDGSQEPVTDDNDNTDDDNKPETGEVNTLDEIQESLWLVIYGGDTTIGMATAFAVGDHWLATNAHVTESIRYTFQTDTNVTAVVVQNETGDYYEITEIWSHPDYDMTTGDYDLGILGVDEYLPTVLQLADDDTIEDLSVFDDIRSCGFPGDLALQTIFETITTGGDYRPRTTCVQGVISSMSPFNSSDPASPDNTFLVQYDFTTSPGTSGSPVFLDDGSIVAVHSLGIGGDEEYNAGMRADLLTELLEAIEDGEVEGTALTDVMPVISGTCNTTWYDPDLQFGFDLPEEFVESQEDAFGEYEFILSNPLTLAAEYTAIYLDTFTWSSELDVAVQIRIENFEDMGYEITGLESFITANGRPARMLWYASAYVGDPEFTIYGIESFVANDSTLFLLRSMTFYSEYVLRQQAIEDTLRSVCAD